MIGAMVDHFEELRSRWTRALGVSGPQWLILIAMANTDQRERGVPITAISKKLRVECTYVMIEARKLEKKGFLRRHEGSAPDALEISLSEKSRNLIVELGLQ
jgi:DNA-binding MarR family transcriptional regulator